MTSIQWTSPMRACRRKRRQDARLASRSASGWGEGRRVTRFYKRPRLQAFDDHGHALTAADAHRLEAVAAAAVLEAVEQRGHDAGAGHPERVAEGDGAAVGVELL